MRNKITISESDRRSILSMYNLITETVREITISGVVKDEISNPLNGSKVEFLDQNDKLLKGTISDDNGNYVLLLKSDNGDFKLRVSNNNLGYPASVFNIEVKEGQNNYKLDIDLKSKERKEVVVTKKIQEVSGKVYDKDGLIINGVKITATSDVETKIIEQQEDGSYIFRSPKQIKSVTLKFEKEDFIPLTEELDFTDENKKVFDVKLLKKTMLNLKVIDSITKNPIKGVNVIFIGLKQKYVTNEKGLVTIKNIETGKEKIKLQLTNYLTKEQTITIKEGENNISIPFDKFGSPAERIDDYKDNLFTIYGRSRNELSYNEALKDAKLEIVNKFIEKNKRTYKNIPPFKNVDLDIKYELVYQKPKRTKEDENFVIVKASKKDIKQFMRDFAATNNIKLDVEPLIWEVGDLEGTIARAKMEGKKVFMFIKAADNELNNKLKTGIEKNSDLVDKINKGYKLIVVDRDNPFFVNKKLSTRVTGLPSVMTIDPKDLDVNYNEGTISNPNLSDNIKTTYSLNDLLRMK